MENRIKVGNERMGRDKVIVVIERIYGRKKWKIKGLRIMKIWRGKEFKKRDGRIMIGGIFGKGKVKEEEWRWRWIELGNGGKRRKVEIEIEGDIRDVDEWIEIGKVENEKGIEGMKEEERLILMIEKKEMRRDSEDKENGKVDRRRGIIIIERNLKVRIEDMKEEGRIDKIKRIEGKKIIGIEMKEKEKEIRIEVGKIILNDVIGGGRNLIKGFGKRIVIFLK